MTTQITEPNEIYAYQPEEVKAVFQTLAMGFHNKKLTFNEFREYLKDLILVDRGGTLWTIGAGSGSWYRREGETWVKDNPAGELFSVYKVIREMKTAMTECPRCRNRIQRGYQFCPHCGAPAAEPAQQVASPPPQRPAPAAKPVFCRKCGKPIQLSAKFCTACGAPRRQ